MRLNETPQFAQGKSVEAFLDVWFEYRGWEIRQTTPHEERALCLGDRRFTKDGVTYLVEYKSGLQTFTTGNVFLETVSVDTANKAGWVYTCQADFVFYACLFNHKILVFKPQRLRDCIEMLKTKFREVSTSKNQNDGYNTWGVIVPLQYAIDNLADKVIEI